MKADRVPVETPVPPSGKESGLRLRIAPVSFQARFLVFSDTLDTGGDERDLQVKEPSAGIFK